MPNNWSGTVASPYLGEFNNGVPNNGPANMAITYSSDSVKYNLVGNPYPSTISANDFIDANTSLIENTLYFWRKTNAATGSAYATWNRGQSLGTSSQGGIAPNGTIQVGQGFFVVAKSSGTLNFTNAVRTTNNDNQFLKSTTTVESNPFWLNVTNDAGAFSQTLVNYLTDATNDVDADLESRYFNDSPFALTSIINNEEYTIQGRALPFDVNDVVAMSFKTATAGTFTISLDHFNGLFTGNQTIYLKDLLTGTITDLKAGSYTFVSDTGTFNSRFQVVYNNPALSTNNTIFNENSVLVYKNNGSVYINSGTVTMDNVKIFDIRGRLLIEKKKVNASQTSIDTSAMANQVLAVQITSDTNAKVSKKVVN